MVDKQHTIAVRGVLTLKWMMAAEQISPGEHRRQMLKNNRAHGWPGSETHNATTTGNDM